MDIRQLEKEMMLRVNQIKHYNISEGQAYRLIKLAFKEYRKEINTIEATNERLKILEEKY